MVAWSSFTAQNLERGFLQFYATGEASIMFDKPILNSGFASAASQTKQCLNQLSLSYSHATANLGVTVSLYPCTTGRCANPCPNILAPQAFGYDVFNSQENQFSFSLNMQAVSTALAVNLGMVLLNHLVMVPGDSDRIDLFNSMIEQGFMNASTASHTTSYYGSFVQFIEIHLHDMCILRVFEFMYLIC